MHSSSIHDVIVIKLIIVISQDKKVASSSRSKTDYSSSSYYTSERSTYSRRSTAQVELTFDGVSRQCYGPGCVEPARVGSKYCSDECGLKLAHKYNNLMILIYLSFLGGEQLLDVFFLSSSFPFYPVINCRLHCFP